MGRKPKTSRPSFFKVLIKDDYTSKLRLPQAFVWKYREILPANAKLRTSCRETWDVKIEETDNDDDDDEKLLCFTEGWNKFAKDIELKLGEFVVLWFDVGKSTFDVSVYGIDACEREISAKNLLPVGSVAADEDFEFTNEFCHNIPDGVSKKRLRSCEAAGTDREAKSGNSGRERERHPRFEVVLTESRKSRVSLPKKFAEAAELTSKRAVVLEYPPKQRCWAVILDRRPRPNFTVDMTAGWKEFRKENGLVLGGTYAFEFDPTKNVIQVKKQRKRKTALK